MAASGGAAGAVADVSGLSWICYFRALERGPVAAVVSVDKLSLVLVVVAAAVMNGERPSWPVALGAVLMTAGAVLVSLPSTP